MATCLLCATRVGDHDVVCPYCGGAVGADDATRHDDPTRVAGSDPVGAAPPPPSWDAPSAPEGWAPPPSAGASVLGSPPPASGWQPPESSGSPPPHGWAPPAPPGWQWPPGQAPWPAPMPGWTPPPPTEGLAAASLAVSLGGLVLALMCGVTILACPAGAVMGHVALRRIARSGAQGRGLALAGVIIGWIGTALLVAGALLIGLLVAASA